MNGSDKQWRDKINSLDNVPGSNFDKGAAWEKLQLRLEGRPVKSSRQKYYIGLAAAVAALCIAVPVLLRQQAGKNNNLPAATATSIPPIHHTSTDEVQHAPAVAVKEKIDAGGKPMHKQAQPPTPQVAVTQENRVPANITEPVHTIIPTMQDSFSPAIPKVAATNKAKVVHINEIDYDAQPQLPEEHTGFMAQRYKYMAQPTTPATTASAGGHIKIRF